MEEASAPVEPVAEVAAEKEEAHKEADKPAEEQVVTGAENATEQPASTEQEEQKQPEE